jgi:hypothetical protein
VRTGAVRAIAGWLTRVCKVPETEDIRIPDFSKSWQQALELRMTMIALGMEQYAQHMTDAYIGNLGGRDLELPEVKLVMDTAVSDDDALLITVANSVSYHLRWHKFSEELELELVEYLSGEEWAPLRKAVREEGVKAFRREELGLGPD